MYENEPELLSKRYENLIPPDSILSNARTVYGELVNETIGEIAFRNKIKVMAVVGEPGAGKTIFSKEIANIVRQNRKDKKLEFFYYDDIHEFIQYITNTKSSNWAQLRDLLHYPDLWQLASTIAFNSILEAIKDPNKIVILEGVFCGVEDRFRSTILKLLNILGEGAVGIVPVVPHTDTQQSAVMLRDTAEISSPRNITQTLRSMNTEPNPNFKSGDPITGEIIKKYLGKSATGSEIADLSHENRRIAEERFLSLPPELIEIYQEILNPKVPDIASLADFGHTARLKALVFIDDFGKAGIEVTPIINMPMMGTVHLYIPSRLEKGRLNTNFVIQLTKIISQKRQSEEWEYEDIRKWFPNLDKIELT